MNYDMALHVPNQVETLLHHRSQSDIDRFEYILEGLKKIMCDHDRFISGLADDQKKREQAHKELFKTTKETILTGFKDKTDDQGVLIASQVVSQLDAAYSNIEHQFMTDAITTITSYDDGRGTEE
jgi:hypothetical protein